MEFKDFLKLLKLNKKYLFISIVICLIAGYFYIIKESHYQYASFSVYLKLNGGVKEGVQFQNTYDELKNTFFILKTAESFIDSIRFYLSNDFKVKGAKIFSRKITPQHLFIKIKTLNTNNLAKLKDEIIKEVINRQDLLLNKDLNLFTVTFSDYKEYQESNFILIIVLSILAGLFIGVSFILFLHYFQ
jgi:hypothetical protein